MFHRVPINHAVPHVHNVPNIPIPNVPALPACVFPSPVPVPWAPLTPCRTENFSSDIKLPSLATIPLLHSAMEWVSWELAVTQIITSIGLWRHICRIPNIGDLRNPTSLVALPPHYNFNSTPEETEAYRIFWQNNDIVEHVLVGKLSQEIQDSPPPKRGGPYDMPICPARELLGFLREHFGIGSASVAEYTKSKVFALVASPTTVTSYVQSWRTVIHQLSGTPWDFTSWQRIQKFVNSLLNGDWWLVLKEEV
ncbi:hypothetical protein C0992_005229 [Termitomyces sp. T32_za158]|nr:hypothetical protein C0992_005229 [Termitomyces sp. T32_za158]